jgi:hypothetical protein
MKLTRVENHTGFYTAISLRHEKQHPKLFKIISSVEEPSYAIQSHKITESEGSDSTLILFCT